MSNETFRDNLISELGFNATEAAALGTIETGLLADVSWVLSRSLASRESISQWMEFPRPSIGGRSAKAAMLAGDVRAVKTLLAIERDS